MEEKKPLKWRGGDEKKGYEQKNWHKRIVAMKDFLDFDEDKSVMDLGAGSMHLRKILPEGVKYYPVDYKKNSDDEIVCDFNKKEFPDLKVDAVIAAGILEYIEDQRWFLDKITESCNKLIISYSGNVMSVDEVTEYMKTKGFSITKKHHRLMALWDMFACFERMTQKKLAKQYHCTGCGACANVCPKDAIEMRYNEEGFLKPHIIEEKCISCQKCVKTCPAACPKKNPAEEKKTGFYATQEDGVFKLLEYKPQPPKPIASYAVWASDEIRMNSSSGGVFPIIAKYMLDKGGRVFGAVWDKDFFCQLQSAKSWEEVLPMRSSKYVQSNTKNTFREVKDLLAKKIPVAYFGLPCQIAGLKNYLNGKTDGLITIDIACYYAPSNVHFRKYLDEEYGLDKVKDVSFRDKSAPTVWSSRSYRIDFKDNKSVYPDWRKNSNWLAFRNRLERSDTCQECQFCGFPRQGDFTIGDFWGVQEDWNDKKGTSIVFANTKLAEKIFAEISSGFQRYEKVPLKQATTKNAFVRRSRPDYPPQRLQFRELIKNHTFREATSYALSGKHDIGYAAWLNSNLGNNLTNWALWRYMTDMGYKVLVIGNPVPQPQSEEDHTVNGDRRIGNFLKSPFPTYDVLPPKTNAEDLKELNKLCNTFIIGSDQVWRKNAFVSKEGEYSYFFALDWVDKDKYKMAYSASFGAAAFSKDEKLRKDLKGYFGRFQRIAVRESSGVNILKKVFGLRGEHVLDPVFLPDIKYYDEMAFNGRIRLPDKPFIGVYLSPDPIKAEILKKAEESYNLPYLAMCRNNVKETFGVNLLSSPAVEEWIADIKYCEFLLTDSFHAICLALLFKKNFVVLYNKKEARYPRLRSLLKILDLESRVVDTGKEPIDDFEEILNTPIDYGKVTALLNQEIDQSKKWLNESLEMGQHFKYSPESEIGFVKPKEKKTVAPNTIKLDNKVFTFGNNAEVKRNEKVFAFGNNAEVKRDDFQITPLKLVLGNFNR